MKFNQTPPRTRAAIHKSLIDLCDQWGLCVDDVIHLAAYHVNHFLTCDDPLTPLTNEQCITYAQTRDELRALANNPKLNE